MAAFHSVEGANPGKRGADRRGVLDQGEIANPDVDAHAELEAGEVLVSRGEPELSRGRMEPAEEAL